MHLFKTKKGNILQLNSEWFLLVAEWDQLINQQNLFDYLTQVASKSERLSSAHAEDFIKQDLF